MALWCGQGAYNARTHVLSPSSCPLRRSLAAQGGGCLRHALTTDVSASVTTSGRSAGGFSADVHGHSNNFPEVSCRAAMVAECEIVAAPTKNEAKAPVGTGQTTSGKLPRIDNIDVAVIGADVAGFAAALAATRANPGARVMLYDTAFEPPPACDGGVLLSVNGLRALRALDPNLYRRILTELASPVAEALWFDLEGELIRRAPLGQAPTAARGANAGGGSSRRRVVSRRLQGRSLTGGSSSSTASEPDASAPPLVMSLHDLREALAEALPEEVQIFGRHHLKSVEPDTSSTAGGGSESAGGGAGGGGGALLRFAGSPGGPSVRSVRTRVLVGADGPQSVVKQLQFDGAQAPPVQPPQTSGRIVWRGRFTLRPRDPDFARLRNFTTAVRTWVDLRALAGAERHASLSPAGPNTYVWSASCPASLLASRGLQETGGASSYWRCLAMFEDFPQDFFAALRATSGSAVVEYGTCRAPPTAEAAASLAAPWRWFSGGGGAAALVGDAVYDFSVDDASSTAINLALEDAAVLGACTAQYGMTSRALQEYARQRGARVSALLALPPSAPERARLRDAPFLPAPPPPALAAQSPAQPSAAAPAVEDVAPGLASTVSSAVDAAAAAVAAMTSPMQPLEEILAKAAAVASSSAAAANDASPVAVDVAAPHPAGRPSGGASRSLASSAPVEPPPPMSAGPSSPLFSRPSGARRMGPMPAAIAAVFGLLAAGAKDSGGAAAAAGAGAGAGSSAAPAAAAAALDSAVGVPAAVAERANSATTTVVPSATKATAATAAVAAGPTITTEDVGVAAAIASVPPAAAEAILAPSTDATEAARSYDAGVSPRSVWESLLLTHESAAAGDTTAAVAAAAQRTARGEYCALATPSAVWRALLVAPAKAHDMLVTLPYNASESPALVWMALLGAAAVASSASVLPSSSAVASASSPASSTSLSDTPRSLLPRPVPKQKSLEPVIATAPTQLEESSNSILDNSLTAVAAAAVPPSPQRQGAPAAAVAASTPSVAAAVLDLHSRRRPHRRQSAGPVSGRWAGGDRRGNGGGKVTAAGGGHSKAKRSAAAGASRTAAAATTVPTAPSSAASRAKSRAKAVAAKAAATVTVSLSAAAALGGVIGAGGSAHVMPVADVAAAALHAHGAVAQFWEELNSLTLSSASLSSIDL